MPNDSTELSVDVEGACSEAAAPGAAEMGTKGEAGDLGEEGGVGSMSVS